MVVFVARYSAKPGIPAVGGAFAFTGTTLAGTFAETLAGTFAETLAGTFAALITGVMMTIITRMAKISRMIFIFEFDCNFDCPLVNFGSLIKYYFRPVII